VIDDQTASSDDGGAEPGEELSGGKLTKVTRHGDVVRRAMGPWSTATHALLRHLEDVGFEEAPRLLDVDEDAGVEILSYLPGACGLVPVDPAIQTDRTLVEAARMIRRYHDAVAGFTPPEDAPWQFMPTAPRSGEIICHNDIAAYNLLYEDGVPTGLIDWDFAAPAPRVWDLAHAMWYLVPLHTPEYLDSVGWAPIDVPRRLRLFCDAYGLEDREGLLETISERQRATYATIDQWAAEGRPGFVELVTNPPKITERPDIPYLRAHLDEWQRAVM
jgi:hypothetical protein